jgi:hypothetical protein
MSHPTIDLGWRVEAREQLATAHPGRLLGYAQRHGDQWQVVIRDGSTERVDDKYSACIRLASLVTARYGEPATAAEVVEHVTAETTERVEPVELATTNPVIAELVAALRLLGADGPAVAVDILKVAPAQLTDREYVQTLGWLGHTRRTCSRCGELVLFVADGPDPGWWSHDLVPEQPHAAVPEVAR